MKTTATAETQFSTTNKKAKKTIHIEFARHGEKGKRNTKELFWITTKSEWDVQTLKALSLDDLKKIVQEAENLIKLADGADLDELK